MRKKTKHAQIKITCCQCQGTGQVPLASCYAESLKLLESLGREATPAELSKRTGTTATAMNNRMTYLESRGLVRSRRDGKRRLFSVI